MAPVRLLAARYELHAVLGRGGMAEVWRGTDRRLGRGVAVKILLPALARGQEFRARFHREAESVAGLNHPSIVAVYDTGVEEIEGVSVPFIVMEHLDGTTLREICHEGRLSAERALAITAEVLDALAYSHQHGIVHRDIKPSNIMVTPSGAVKVMDFGIARVLTDMSAALTRTAAVIGTAEYLSPEQARGRRIDARSDVYSTGCMLYQLLTGRPPFAGESLIAIAYQHVHDEPVPATVVNPDVAVEHAAIVMHALEKDPDRRYQSAGEMRDAIRAILAGEHLPPMEIAETAERPAVSADEPMARTAETVLAMSAATDRTEVNGPEPEPSLAAVAPASRRRTYALFSVAFAAVIAMVAIGITQLGGEEPPASGDLPGGRVSGSATPTRGGHGHATSGPSNLPVDNGPTSERGKRSTPAADTSDTATPAGDAPTPGTASPTPSARPTASSGSPRPTNSPSPSHSASESPSESPSPSSQAHA